MKNMSKNKLLLDVQYVRGKKTKTEKQPDCLYTIYRDLDTMEKKMDLIV